MALVPAATTFVGMEYGFPIFQLSPAHRQMLDAVFYDEGMGAIGVTRLWNRVRTRAGHPSYRATRFYHRSQSTPQIMRPQKKVPSTVKIIAKRPWTRLQIDGLAVPVKNPKNDPFGRKPYWMSYGVIDIFSRMAYSRLFPRKGVAFAASVLIEALDDASRRYGLPPGTLPRRVLLNYDGEFNTPLFRNPILSRFGPVQVSFLKNPPAVPNAAAHIERFNGSMVNLMGRAKQALTRTVTGTRWRGTQQDYLALWQRALDLYNTSVHSATRARPVDLVALTDAQAAAYVAQRDGRQVRARPNFSHLPDRARQAELMAVGSLHRLVNAALQKAELRGFQKWASERFSFEIYTVTRFARTQQNENQRVFVRELKQGYPNITQAQVDTMTVAQVRANLMRRRQPARYPRGSESRDGNNILQQNSAPEKRDDMRARLKAKLRQEAADIAASANGDGVLPYSFAYQQLSPVQDPTEWRGDNGRTYY